LACAIFGGSQVAALIQIKPVGPLGDDVRFRLGAEIHLQGRGRRGADAWPLFKKARMGT
jgi:hypothetical protein